MKILKRMFPIIIIIAVICTFILIHFYKNTSTTEEEGEYQKEIERVKSTVDKDGDGIDDYTDILESALAYVDTKPKYESRYYQGGYPDDGYGVCTDVVAEAMLGAGYDLMELVNEDIKEHREDYNIKEPDPNIDYRRVRNLKVFFMHNAKSLTTKISDIEKWQGGDIVIFKNHIGIVSDRRNKKGVPYIIHHGRVGQKKYEEDYLRKHKNEIVGHYRWDKEETERR